MGRAGIATTLVLAIFVGGCTGGGPPSVSQAPAASTQATSGQITPTTTEPPSSAMCEPGDAETFRMAVLATSNIFGAGRDAAPAPGGGGAGTLPPVCELPFGSTFITFPAVAGEVTPYDEQPLRNGPAGDRLGAGGENTEVTSYDGISGIVNRGNGMFLVGVFLAEAMPADPAPARLDFTDAEDFAELAPEIAQTFLVGDGVGRRYRIPPGATRLFLGFADAFLYEGAPGWYGNNAGQLDVTMAIEGVVSAFANIFGAGHEKPPAPGGGGAGRLPPVWAIPQGETMIVTVPTAQGQVYGRVGQAPANGPGGEDIIGTDVESYGGISGIVHEDKAMFLVGVFLTDDPPADPAPARLDFTDNEDFDLLEPEIAQTFLIGDGVGHRYLVPQGATRLFLGFAEGMFYVGPPGWYGNNAGELVVEVATG